MSIFHLPNGPPFRPGEFPDNLPKEVTALLGPLQQMAAATLVTVTEHEMILALGRDPFGRKVNGTRVVAGINTINVCLLDSVILSLCAIFDQKGDGIRLRTIMNKLSDSRYEPLFESFHAKAKTGRDTARLRLQLGQLQRRLKRARISHALERIERLRSQAIAHFDMSPDFSAGWPMIRDVTMTVAFTANVVVKATHYMTCRKLDTVLSRANAKGQAAAVADAIRPSVIGRRAGEFGYRIFFVHPGS